MYWSRVIVTKKGLYELLYNQPAVGNAYKVKIETDTVIHRAAKHDYEMKWQKAKSQKFKPLKNLQIGIQKQTSSRNNFRKKSNQFREEINREIEEYEQKHEHD